MIATENGLRMDDRNIHQRVTFKGTGKTTIIQVLFEMCMTFCKLKLSTGGCE